MVFLKTKISEEDYFIFETRTDILIDQVIRDLVQVYNRRIKLQMLVQEVQQLAQFGIMKHPEKQGLDDEHEEAEEIEGIKFEAEEEDTVDEDMVDAPARRDRKTGAYKKDPTGRREGYPPPKNLVEKIQGTLDEAKKLMGKERADRRLTISDYDVKEAINLIRGGIMIAYPMGLPKWDTVEQLISGDFAYPDYHEPGTATLWFAGKELQRGKKLKDTRSVGKNEKTTIVVKLQKKGSGPPVRESVVTSEEQKKLMAYWYKKQEEDKKLAEDDDNSHFNSEWSNPRGLKSEFQGTTDIKWR